MPDFSGVSVFQTVVEQGSFSQAAEQLGITTSAVSRRISGLEEHLGVKLLNRTTRSLSLTESGQRYLEYARQAQQALIDAENAAREKKDVASGVLKLNAPVNLGREKLAEIIPEFLKANPMVSFHITLNDVFTKINPDDYDLIITTSQVPRGSFISTKFYSIQGAVVASPEYLEKHGHPQIPEELQNHNCLLPSFSEVQDNWLLYKDEQEIKVQVTGNFFCNNPVSVGIAALKGIGIACLPLPQIKQDIDDGRLVQLFPDYQLPERALRAYYSDKHFVPAKIRVFVDFLMQHLGSER